MSNFNKTLLENLDSLNNFITESDDFEIVNARKENTGGHVDVYTGTLAGGRYFILTDDFFKTYDTDPSEVMDDPDFDEDDFDYRHVEEYFDNTDQEYKRVKQAILNKINLKEDASGKDDLIKVFMNTWANYNEYGASEGITPVGWMTPEEAVEYAKKYQEYEPFINDTENCPWDAEENGIAHELPNMQAYNEFEDKTLLKNLIETGRYNDIEDYISIAIDGDYIWFPGVKDDKELGEADVDMLGGIESVQNPWQYFDTSQRANELEIDMGAEEGNEDLSRSDYEQFAEEEAENMEEAGNLDYIERYFDYEAFGRNLRMDGFTYTTDGAVQIIR